MKKILNSVFYVYAMFCLFYTLITFDQFMMEYSFYYFDHDIALYNLGIVLLILILWLSYKNKIRPISLILIILVVNRCLYVMNHALELGLTLNNLFFGQIGLIRFISYLIIILLNLLLSKINIDKFQIPSVFIIVLSLIASFLFAFNYGVFNNELALERTSFDFDNGLHILLFAFLNLSQLDVFDIKNNKYHLK